MILSTQMILFQELINCFRRRKVVVVRTELVKSDTRFLGSGTLMSLLSITTTMTLIRAMSLSCHREEALRKRNQLLSTMFCSGCETERTQSMILPMESFSSSTSFYLSREGRHHWKEPGISTMPYYGQGITPLQTNQLTVMMRK